MLEINDLNYLAILLAVLVNVGVGSWWYSPAGFGKKWTKYSKVDMMKSPKQETQRAIAVVFIGAIIQAVVLAVVLKSIQADTITEGLITSFILWLGFVAATSIGDDLYSRKGWSYWWINASFFLVTMLVNGAIIAVLQG